MEVTCDQLIQHLPNLVLVCIVGYMIYITGYYRGEINQLNKKLRKQKEP